MNKLQQFYVLKFNSGRLAKNGYNINITMKTAKKNNELIALGDNQVLRSIRKIKGRNIDFDFINIFLNKEYGISPSISSST